MKKRILGFNIGATYVAYTLFENNDDGDFMPIDGAIRLFKKADSKDNQKRGSDRRSRRTKKRRNRRLDLVKKLFIEEGLFENKATLEEARRTYLINHKNVTPYHLRVKGLSEELSPIELYISLYQVMKHRGVFYADVLDEEQQENLKTEGYPCICQLEQYKRFKESNNSELYRVRSKKNLYTNANYVHEIETIFKHISYVSNIFKNKYFELLTRKRAYFDGPGNADSSSPYKLYTYDENGNIINTFIDKLRGHCTYFQDEYCACSKSFHAELFNLLNDLNNTLFNGERLTSEEKLKVIEYAKYQAPKSRKALSKKDLEKALGFSIHSISGCRINSKGEPLFTVLSGFVALREICKKSNTDIRTLEDMGCIEQIIEICTIGQHYDQRLSMLQKYCNENHFDIDAILQDNLANNSFTQFHSLSLKLIEELLPMMLATNKNSMQLLAEKQYQKLLSKKYEQETLEPIIVTGMSSAIHRAYTQTLRICSALEKKYGAFDSIAIAVNQENRSPKQIKDEQTKNEKMNKKIKATLLEFGVEKKYDSNLFDKVRFYYEQQGKDVYTGKKIDLERLIKDPFYCAVDYIIPRKVSYDESSQNKVLTFSEINAKKGDESPYTFFLSSEKEIGRNYDSYKKNVETIFAKNSQKRKNLLFEEDLNKWPIRIHFLRKNVADNSYVSRQIINHLKYYYQNKNIPTRVFGVQKRTISFVRKNIQLYNKKTLEDRGTQFKDFIDYGRDSYIVGLLACTPLFQQLKNYSLENLENTPAFSLYSYDDLSKNDLRCTLRTEIENMPYRFSHKIEKAINGQFLNETIYSTRIVDKVEKVVEKKDLYDPKKDYAEYFGFNPKYRESMLMVEHDIRTYDILCSIWNEYHDCVIDDKKIKNPFVAHKLVTKQPIRKYSKKGNGPLVHSFHTYAGTLNIYKDISHHYDNLNKEKKVVLLSMKPFRIDVYKNKNKDAKVLYKYVVVSLHMLKTKGSMKYIDLIEYNNRKKQKHITDEYEFIYSVYRRDVLHIKNTNKEQYGYLVGSSSVESNSLIFKPIDYTSKSSEMIISVGKNTKEITKYSTDILGNCYAVKREKLQMKFAL